MEFLRSLRQSTVAQAPLLGMAALFVLAQVVLQAFYPAMTVPAENSVLAVLASTLLILLIVLVAYIFVRMLLTDRSKRPVLQLVRRVWRFLCDADAMALGLPAFVSLVIFIYAFSNVKGNIPAIQPFAWDPVLDRWDLLLHFGRRPWEWLQPVLGYWPVTFLVNLLYDLWFVVMFGVWLNFAFMAAPGVARTRFFFAFMLLWMIGGGLFAVALSSAGPCFYGAGFLGLSPDPYAGLMAYLHRANEMVPVWALAVQDELWKLHKAGSAEASISAMPSMHNGSTLLFALASAGWPRWIRIGLWAYVPVIFIGSIHLGFHYALDGYAAWLLALAAWWVAGALARRWEEVAPAARFRITFAESPASLGQWNGVG